MKFKVTVEKGNDKLVWELHAPNEREVKRLANQIIEASHPGYKFKYAITQ